MSFRTSLLRCFVHLKSFKISSNEILRKYFLTFNCKGTNTSGARFFNFLHKHLRREWCMALTGYFQSCTFGQKR